ncbi:DUF2243 domain-containing protein [Brevibacillus fulvus]|nr:DUF2243 domain-containing protein [Brevibacillus fulvus]
MGAFLFGVGLIGMLDGIVFHQLLQWHSVYMPTDRFHQIVSDGLFHLLVTGIIFISGLFLWKGDHHVHGGIFWGGLLLGGGSFNLLEGIIDHHLLQIHHVKPGPYQLHYDLAYDLAALLFLLAGWLLYRQGQAAQSR